MPISIIIQGRLAALTQEANDLRARADSLTYRARLLAATYLLRDRFPTVAVVVADVEHPDDHEESGIEIHSLLTTDGDLLWRRQDGVQGYPAQTQQDAAYRTVDGHDWEIVLSHAGHELTLALAGNTPAQRWTSRDERFLFDVALPSVEDLATAMDAQQATAAVARHREFGLTAWSDWGATVNGYGPYLTVAGVRVQGWVDSETGALTVDIITAGADPALHIPATAVAALRATVDGRLVYDAASEHAAAVL
jgi:hypothetical protein